MDIIDFHKDSDFHKLFYDIPESDDVKKLARFLKNKKNYVRLFHGTSSRHDILKDGLKSTSSTRRHSYQSACGYVHLSIYPGMDKTFREMAYPQR